MDRPSLSEILNAARQLPPEARSELVQALLNDASTSASTPALEPLTGMSDTELRTLAGAVLAPGHQRRLKNLLRKNREGKLDDAGRRALDTLIEESDRMALLEARAAYTLSRATSPTTRAA